MTSPDTCRIAVLDDHQGVALTSADWSLLPPAAPSTWPASGSSARTWWPSWTARVPSW